MLQASQFISVNGVCIIIDILHSILKFEIPPPPKETWKSIWFIIIRQLKNENLKKQMVLNKVIFSAPFVYTLSILRILIGLEWKM